MLVFSRNWVFAFIAVLFALVLGYLLFKTTTFVYMKYQSMRELVKKKEKEIELLTDLWKIDEAEIEWIEPVSRGKIDRFFDFLMFHSKSILLGGFGEVWKCEWREHVVAVKKLMKHWMNSGDEGNLSFQKEIQFLQTIRHPNIVLFYGAGETEVTIQEHHRF